MTVFEAGDAMARTLLESRVMLHLSTILAAMRPTTGRWTLGLALALAPLAVAAQPADSASNGTIGGRATSAAAAAVKTTAARAELAERVLAVGRLEASRQALSGSSEGLAAEIAGLKSQGARPLLPGVAIGGLDEHLKQAQALAGQLALLDRQVDDARSAVVTARTALAAALDAQMADLRQGLASADEANRRAQFQTLRRLMDERSALAAAASAAGPTSVGARVELPAVDPGQIAPGELRDLADETRDHAEAVKRQLSAVEERLGQLQARRRLLRSATAFTRDESLFAEDERARKVFGAQARLEAAGAHSRTPDSNGAVATSTSNPTADRGAESSAVAGPQAPMAGGAEQNDGAPGAGSDFANGTSGGGAADPAPPPPPPPVASPAGGYTNAPVGAGGTTQPALVIQDGVDPQLLAGDLRALSPGALADQIRELESRRKQLEQTSQQLETRQRVLEHEAATGEGADGD